MLGDQRRGPWIVRKPRAGARPDAMSNAERRSHEIDDGAGLGIDRGRRVFLGPAVVVLADRMENRVLPRPCGKRHAVLHDPAGEVRVIGLRDQLEAVVDDANDHGLQPSRVSRDPELT
jgi:hypothetical protein